MKSRTGAALLLVGTFLLGGVTGAVSHYIYRNHVEASSPKSRSRMSASQIVQEMSKDMSLDPEQQEKLKVIIERSRDRYKTLSKEFRPQYNTIRQETRNEIRGILRADQIEIFERQIKEIDSKRKKGRSRDSD